MRLLMRFARFLYGLKTQSTGNYDVIVPLGYGLDVENNLPVAEQQVLTMAVSMAKSNQALLVWASSSYFFRGSEKHEDQLKEKFVRDQKFAGEVVVSSGISNSVTEAREIKEALQRKGVKSGRFAVVLDWPHARSARKIWRKTFPGFSIDFVSIQGVWNRSNRAYLQQSEFRWLAACILRHVALIVLGLDRVAKIQHPIEK
ncbi:MAG: hypothetical protein V4481_00260 [Patescibacteria group bacterium]